MCIINIKSISKTYIKENEIIHALKSITYNFEIGKFYAIMGNSGSGKSTLLNCLGLLDEIDNGEIVINNINVSCLSDDQMSEFRRNKIGFIFQDYYLNPNMKAYENVMLPLFLNKNISEKEKKQKAIKILESLGLKDRVNHFPKELSGGEQQRVAIARALINNPDIILADEPTGNLDDENEKKIFALLKKISKKGKCVIVVTHNSIIKNYADKVINLKKGEMYE